MDKTIECSSEYNLTGTNVFARLTKLQVTQKLDSACLLYLFIFILGQGKIVVLRKSPYEMLDEGEISVLTYMRQFYASCKYPRSN